MAKAKTNVAVQQNTAPVIKYAPRTWLPTSVITLVQCSNPKKGASYARYALYTTGLTVAGYQKAVVGKGLGTAAKATADLRWDVQRGFITITPVAQ